MWTKENEFIVRCGCGDTTENIHFSFWYDVMPLFEKEGGEKVSDWVSLEIGLNFSNDMTLRGRIKNALKLLFKKKDVFLGGITVDLADPEQRKEMARLGLWLHRCVKEAKKLKPIDEPKKPRGRRKKIPEAVKPSATD